ncbi:MAG TPA: hypothetical protein VMX97_01325 [Hyphomicrobiaceae bacterium]|nr:hypothetical protein [Hyphomicrobiaceae bacterium]HUU73750.1 hypothetical protein [Burkholderiales bacterium]
MRTYTRNSPEAVSRLVAMALITDAEVDDRELDALDRMNFYGDVGINKWAFGDVLADFCDDLKRKADPRGRIRLLDRRQLDHALSEVDDPLLRAKTVALIANLVKSDGRVATQEAAFLAYLLKQWDFSTDAAVSAGLH